MVAANSNRLDEIPQIQVYVLHHLRYITAAATLTINRAGLWKTLYLILLKSRYGSKSDFILVPA
jgi:hypothetical protein